MIILGLILLLIGILAKTAIVWTIGIVVPAVGLILVSSARSAGALVADGITGSQPWANPASGGVPCSSPGAPQRGIPDQEAPYCEVPHLAIEVTVSAGTATVALDGELDPVTMPQLARRLAQVLADRPQRLVLDLAGVSSIDCASARLITSAGRHLPAGVRPAVRFPSVAVRRVLVLTGLVDHLELEPAGGE